MTGFVNNLILQFGKNEQSELSLGLIYAYEKPENHIQLCDGQQRITTLYLLLGMLNRQTGMNHFRRRLISDYEYLYDDKEPYLLYSIRENSLYFMSDLVCRFFINEEGCGDAAGVGSIPEQPWFFNDYNNDPSISSICKALAIIEELLKGRSAEWCRDFGDYLTNRLSFLYYDLENRENGEETFVVINTTGEPLSAAQNLKPLICNAEINKGYDNDSISEDWEEIETWFWQHRSPYNDTADAGFNEFLRWITILSHDTYDTRGIAQVKNILEKGEYSFPVEQFKFAELYEYWKTVRFLFEEWEHRNCLKKEFLSPSHNNDLDGLKCMSQRDCFQLLPLIEYCKKWDIRAAGDRDLYRMYMFLHNLCRIDNVNKAINELVHQAINIARNCRHITELATADLKISRIILSEEELQKLAILKAAGNDGAMRERIEEAFWRAQSCSQVRSHQIWSGQILPLIEWASAEGAFSIDKFDEYLAIFDNTFTGECDGCIDNVRRALLTRGLERYPRIFHGKAIWSFGWEWSDWQTLINENKAGFKAFFDDLTGGTTCEQMIDNYPANNMWAEFVHEKRLMEYCKEKKLQYYNSSWFLMKMERWSGAHINVNAYKYHLHLTDKEIEFEGWKGPGLWTEGNTCIHFDKIHGPGQYIAIDVIWNAGGNYDQVEIDLFMKPTGRPEVADYAKEHLGTIAEDSGYAWDEKSKRYLKYIEACKSSEDLYKEIDTEIYNITRGSA